MTRWQTKGERHLDALLTWFVAELDRRTRAVLLDGSANVYWVYPEQRVSWTEICQKAEQLEIFTNPVDFRYAWEAALRGSADAKKAITAAKRAAPL